MTRRGPTSIRGSFADIVLEPLKQCRAGKGPERVSSALLHGLVSFMKHVTVESIDLTERIFMGTQTALEYVNGYLHEPRALHEVPLRSTPLRDFSSPDWTPVERG